VVLLVLALLSLASASIMLTGPTMSDRLLGFNLLASKLTMLVIVYALKQQIPFYLDIALVFSLVGFIGVIFIGNFILKKGRI